MVASDDEKGWIEESRKGNAEAFAALIAQYQKMIHALTYRMTGSMSDAEDLAQETFIRAFRQIGAFEGKAKFSSWLYRIAVNACLNWRQRESRRAEIHSQWAKTNLTEDRSSKSVAGDEALNDRLQQALIRLPAKQRAAVVLTVCEGFSHAEAARALSCTEATVSWRVFAARGKLRRWLSTPGRVQ